MAMQTTIGSGDNVPQALRLRNHTPAAPREESGNYGPTRLHTMALDGIHRARLGAWFDPFRMIEALGRQVLFANGDAVRAHLDGDCVEIAFVRGDSRETDLNAFLGVALILFEDVGVSTPPPSSVVELAGYLAMPDPTVPPALEILLQRHMPIGFMRDHQRRRRWDHAGFYVR
jgi:hypothetical protein